MSLCPTRLKKNQNIKYFSLCFFLQLMLLLFLKHKFMFLQIEIEHKEIRNVMLECIYNLTRKPKRNSYQNFCSTANKS